MAPPLAVRIPHLYGGFFMYDVDVPSSSLRARRVRSALIGLGAGVALAVLYFASLSYFIGKLFDGDSALKTAAEFIFMTLLLPFSYVINSVDVPGVNADGLVLLIPTASYPFLGALAGFLARTEQRPAIVAIEVALVVSLVGSCAVTLSEFIM